MKPALVILAVSVIITLLGFGAGMLLHDKTAKVEKKHFSKLPRQNPEKIRDDGKSYPIEEKK